MKALRRARLSAIGLAAVLTAAAGCQDNPPDQIIPQFDRPQDATFACFQLVNDVFQPVPVDSCRHDSGMLNTKLFAFVTQTTPGEVAVVDLSRGRALDQDQRAPYLSFIPVGGQPSDIATNAAGTRVYTANYETGDLSAINTADAFSSTLKPSVAIDLGGAAARLIVSRVKVDPRAVNPCGGAPVAAGTPSEADFAFVTQPTLGRLAIVALCPTPAEDDAEGRLVGYLPMAPFFAPSAPASNDTDSASNSDTGSGTDTAVDSSSSSDTAPAPDSGTNTFNGPWSITASKRGTLLYISGLHSPVIAVLDRELLVSKALAAAKTEAVELTLSAAERSVLTAEVTQGGQTRSYDIGAMVLDPLVEQWLYAIELKSGGVVVMRLPHEEAGEPMPLPAELIKVNANVPYAGDAYVLGVPGRATSLAIFEADEVLPEGSEDILPGDPLTFDGLFGVVGTTRGRAYIIDISNRDGNPAFDHTFRSAVNLMNPTDDEKRHLVDAPQLISEGNPVGEAAALNLAHFVVAEVPDGGVDTETSTSSDASSDTGTGPTASDADSASGSEGTDTADTADGTDTPTNGTDTAADGDIDTDFADTADEFGFRFRVNDHYWSRERWTLAWEGAIGLSGGAVVDYERSSADEGRWLVIDEAADFCAKDVAARDDALCYAGDLFVITSLPMPADAADKKTCAQLYGDNEFVFTVSRVLATNELEIVNYFTRSPAPALVARCYGQAFTYEVRANGHWVISGSISGQIFQPGLFDAKGLRCVPDPAANPTAAVGRAHRVVSGVPFENYYLAFTVLNGPVLKPKAVLPTCATPSPVSDTDSEEPPQDLGFAFVTAGGYAPLMLGLDASDITDIDMAPDDSLVLVDQAGLGLIRYDVLGSFSVIGEPIN